jgi:magnesium transporter
MPDELNPQHNHLGRNLGGAIGKTIGKTLGGAVDLAVGTVGEVGKLVGTALRLPALPGLKRGAARRHRPRPGSVGGIEAVPDIDKPPAPGTVHIRCIDYAKDRVESFEADDLDAFLAQPRPEWVTVRWINVDGLHPWVVNRIRKKFEFHTLAAEDVLHVPQRPKVEEYDHEIFVTTRMMRLVDGRVSAEQISMFYLPDQLVTFQ